MSEANQAASREAPRYLPFALVAATAFLVDQLSKAYVSSYLHGVANRDGMPVDDVRVHLLGGKLTVDLVTNSGAAFGVLPNQTILFTLIAVGIIGAMVFSYHRLAEGPVWLRLGLGLVLGGALGNLLDRLRFGHVIDFIDLGWWPVFNVADSCIVLGVAILMTTLLFQAERQIEAG